MKPYANEIYFGTVAMERNRWSKEQIPSFAVSAWMDRYQQAGFSGVELWENHYLRATDDERDAIRRHPLPVKILNSYVRFDDDAADARASVAAAVTALDCEGVKFNFGHDADRLGEYTKNFGAWIKTLPADVRILCECHSRTVLETPAAVQTLLDTLADPRLELILHGPTVDPTDLAPWFDRFAERITHIHIQARKQNLAADPEGLRARFDGLRRFAFAGSYALEFVEHSAQPGETHDLLWEEAARDLPVLLSALSKEPA